VLAPAGVSSGRKVEILTAETVRQAVAAGLDADPTKPG
jgi:hypothetical protein